MVHEESYEGLDAESDDKETIKSQLYHELIKRSKGHHKYALSFAFILYDSTNPNLKKVLTDRDYWKALDVITGDYLVIYDFHYNRMKEWIADRSDLEEYYIIALKELFGSITEVQFPAILFFQVNKKMIIDAFIIELNDQNIDDSFNELKEYFESAVKALKDITPKNRKNYQEVFDCLKREVEALKFWKKIDKIGKKGIPVVSLIFKLFSFIH